MKYSISLRSAQNHMQIIQETVDTSLLREQIRWPENILCACFPNFALGDITERAQNQL